MTEQVKSPQRVALKRGAVEGLAVVLVIAVLTGLSHTLEALNLGYGLPESIRSGVILAIPLVVAALRAYEVQWDEQPATRAE